MTIFSGQSVISRVYTSRFGNGTARWNLDRSGTKKYQVPGTVPSGKPPKSEPYRTVPCRTMQWKSAIRVPIMIIQPLSCLQCQFRVFKDRTACLALSDWYPLWLFMKREKNVCLLDLIATLSSLVSAKWLHKSWAWYREEIQYVLLDV